jgi:hypothetical protein
MSSSPNISVRPQYTEDEIREQAAAFDQRFGNNAFEFLNRPEQQIREDMRGVFPQDSIDSAIREERERTIGTIGEVQAYRFSAKTTDGREIEQMVAASNLYVAERQGWDAIRERDQSGVQIASAKLEWTDAEGPQVEYLYDKAQGFEVNRPSGITLSHEQVKVAREDAAYRAAGLEPDASAVPDVDRRSRVDTEHELERFKKEQEIERRADHLRVRDWNGIVEDGSVAAKSPERSIQDLKPPSEMTKPEIVAEARDLHAHFTELMQRFEETPAGPERSHLRDEMKPLVLRENELREEYTGRVKAEMTQDRVPEQSIGYGR